MAAHILAVDDNPTNLKLACDLLESEGYAVSRATNGAEALKLIGNTLPDLILMDIAMPGMDGLTLTRKLKDDERTRHIPIIILTASAMKGDEERASTSGFDAYITKPIVINDFLSKVKEILP